MDVIFERVIEAMKNADMVMREFAKANNDVQAIYQRVNDLRAEERDLIAKRKEYDELESKIAKLRQSVKAFVERSI